VIQRPNRKLAPRPLPAHLASAALLWLSSRAALPVWRTVLPPSSGAGRHLRALAEEIDACGFDRFAAALDREIADRAAAYIDGLEAYRRHPYRRPAIPPAVRWREGASRLLDYGSDRAEPAVLVIPSLINRYYVLDLLPERSFLRHLAAAGLRPLVVDWGEPGSAESQLNLAGYIDRLSRAFDVAAQVAVGRLAVVGYCMGGLLALALTLRRQRTVSCLALLATPWDFRAGRQAQARLVGAFGDCLADAETGTLPVEIVQTLFFMLDPFLGQRKFVRFAAHDPAGEAARSFVALEDWINDGVPLPLPVARECLASWYGDNAPARGQWRVAGTTVEPHRFRRPTLVVIPGRDRIVPPAAAEPLAAAIPAAEVLCPPLGHIGMMSAAAAPSLLWDPLVQWLQARAARRRRLDSGRTRP
jgi:polyhydroxyalkanoate synthase subunit PhaC